MARSFLSLDEGDGEFEKLPPDIYLTVKSKPLPPQRAVPQDTQSKPLSPIAERVIALAWDAEFILSAPDFGAFAFLPSDADDVAFGHRHGFGVAEPQADWIIVYRNTNEES